MNQIARQSETLKKNRGDGYFVCANFLNWHRATNLPSAIQGLERRGKDLDLYADDFGVWWVPGNVKDEIHILEGAPTTDGKIWIGRFEHKPMKLRNLCYKKRRSGGGNL